MAFGFRNQGENVPIPGTANIKNLEDKICVSSMLFSEEPQEIERAVSIEDIVGHQRNMRILPGFVH